MIKKEKLLHQIDALIDLERSIAPLLNKHISSSLFFSPLKQDDRDKAIERFKNIVITQAKHIEVLSGIRDEIRKGQSDVY